MPTYPRIRIKEFNELRVRTRVVGSLLDESTDRLLTEPITPKLRRWVSQRGHIVLMPRVVHSSTDFNGSRFISVTYALSIISTTDVVALAYGNAG